MPKCSSCGANVSSRDQACSYCGTENLNYQPPADEVNALLEKAMEAYQHEHYASASDCYKQVIGLDPEAFSAYFYLAASQTILKRPEEAVKAMQKAQMLRPGSVATYFNLGVLYKQLGRKAEARKQLETGLKIIDTDCAIMNCDQFKRNLEKELADLKRWKLF
jgi:tetratricopeptide (TPR) repeat protein